jgi:hypothetical protein
MAALRPLSTGELLDRTFALYRNYFGLFVGIFAIPHLIVLAYNCLGITFQRPDPQFSTIMLTMVWGLGSIILSMIASGASQAATVIAVSHVHLDRPATVSDSFARVRYQIFPVIGISFLVAFAAGVACLALIVPGVILFIMWSLAIPVKILENRGALDSMSRSSDLTKGSRWRIFVIGFLIILLTIGVSMLLQWPIGIAAGINVIAARGRQSLGAGWQVASLVATFVSQCLVGPLATIALSLVYYDQRVRKEAFDLQLMMTTLDAPVTPGSPAQVGA